MKWLSVRLILKTQFNGWKFLLPFILVVGCQFPRDVDGTLEKVQNGILKVGVTENPPWVIRTNSGAAGIEPEIILALAETLNAEVHWYWDNETELLQALSERQVDVVIGGLIKESPLKKLVTFTKPYYRNRITVGFPAPHSIPSTLEDVEVAVPVVNQINKTLTSRGAIPKPMETINPNMPVAHPEWWLKANGYQVGPWTLLTQKHVMAVSKGENAFLMKLQRHLNNFSPIEQRLQQLARMP